MNKVSRIINKVMRLYRDRGLLLSIFALLHHFKVSLKSKAYAKRLGLKSFSVDDGEFIPNLSNLALSENFLAGKNLWLEAVSQYKSQKFYPKIEIGKNFTCSWNVHIAAINKITIGNNVLIGSKVLITDHTHGTYSSTDAFIMPDQSPSVKPLHTKGPVIIEDNVFIGDGVIIMPNVKIGIGAVIAANSVVLTDIPRHVIAGGIPAKILKKSGSNQ